MNGSARETQIALHRRTAEITWAAAGLFFRRLLALRIFRACTEFGLGCGPPVSSAVSQDRFIRVIRPGSKGLNILRDNEEFQVEAVFFNPSFQAVAYRGRLASNTHASVDDVIPLQNIVEVAGESVCALYDLETGELQNIDA